MTNATQFGPRIEGDLTRFRLWAPGQSSVTVAVESIGSIAMGRTADGWWEATMHCGDGARYSFQLADGQRVADPASRFQAGDVHGPSIVVDQNRYAWRCQDWRGRPWHGTVFYELHAGIMGGYKGIADDLPRLAKLGITAIELMPIAEFAGRRNWGYDGVLPFAPSGSYGTPDELKAMIDRAHELGLMVFLDVVYNHFGPDGNWLPVIAPEFFRSDISTPWGASIDFGRPEVRRYFIENALYWLGDYRFDGLRLDAVHVISEPDWLDEMAAIVRKTFPARHVHIVFENEHNDADHLRLQVDAQWNDDFHNVMHVLLTGETDAYYGDFAHDAAEQLARSLAEGFIYQGQTSPLQGKARGTPSADLRPTAFVDFLQNHDQVGNRALGERLIHLTDSASLKAATALLLLSPHIPLIFMGEEMGAREPFLFFTDFHDELAEAVREGRRKEFAGHPAFADPDARKQIPDPNAFSTFEASRPTGSAPDSEMWLDFYTALLNLRAEHIMPGLPGAVSSGAEVIGDKAVTAGWTLGNGKRLVIAMNLGADSVRIDPPAEAGLWGEPSGSSLPPRTTWVWLG